MIKWIWEQWGNICINPPTTGSTEKILVADGVKALLKKKNTKLVNVAPGCTSRVQPLDVSFNKPFKDIVRQQFEKQRRVLVTKWVGKAWTEVGSNRDMVVRSFRKWDIYLSLDGSENREIYIESIEEYELPTANEITGFELDRESETEEDEDNFEVTDSSSFSKNESCD